MDPYTRFIPDSMPPSGPNEIQLELTMLMDYLPELAAKGLAIAGRLSMTNIWDAITLKPGDARDHLQTLIQRWLDGDHKPKSPHTLSFFTGVVRGCGKGKLAKRMEKEIKEKYPLGTGEIQKYDGQMLSIPGASELQLNPTHAGINETPSNTSLEPQQPATATPVHLPPGSASFTPHQPLSSIPNPTKDDVLKARSQYLELLYQFRTNERRHGLEAHQGQDYGQDCISMNDLSEFAKSVFRIVIERGSGNNKRKSFGSGCFITVNGYSWILTCCHNFVADRNDGELLKEGRGQEVVDLEEKMKEGMVISSLVFADDTFHLPEDQGLRIPLTDVVPDVSDCLVYPAKDILAIPCAIPEEYQPGTFEMDFEKHNDHVPRSGDFLYVVQNPRNIPDDERDIPPNIHVQCSVGMLWQTEDPISYDALTYKGSSGSPILFVSSQGPILIGVHRKGGIVCNHGSLLPKELILAMSGMEKRPL